MENLTCFKGTMVHLEFVIHGQQPNLQMLVIEPESFTDRFEKVLLGSNRETKGQILFPKRDIILVFRGQFVIKLNDAFKNQIVSWLFLRDLQLSITGFASLFEINFKLDRFEMF